MTTDTTKETNCKNPFLLHGASNGKQADQVADSLGIGHCWNSDEERGEYQGYPEAWADFLVDPSDAPFLRHAWQERTSDKMLSETAALLGWHPFFCTVGYTIDYDGVPVYYKDHLDPDRVDTSVFVERHYSLMASQGTGY